MGCVPSQYESVKYEQIKGKLMTGDLLLFSGIGEDSCKIKTATCSPFSHVGMVIKCDHIKGPTFGRSDSDGLYLWHSPSDILPGSQDVIGRKTKNGPQLNALRYELEHTDSSIYLRFLETRVNPRTGKSFPGSMALTDPCGSGLMDFMREASTVPYEKNLSELYKSAWDGPCGRNDKNTSSYFCSELVAQTLMKMNILSEEDDPSNEYIPADFASDYLPLKHGYEYDNKILRIIM